MRILTACNREVFFVQSACADLLAGVVVGSEQRCAKICFKLPKTRLIVKFTIAVSGWASRQQKHAINCTKSRSELHPKSRGWLSGASNVARKSALIWLSGTPRVAKKPQAGGICKATSATSPRQPNQLSRREFFPPRPTSSDCARFAPFQATVRGSHTTRKPS